MAKLIVNPTSTSKREIPLPRSLLSIGRDPSNDLVLPDAMVSRRHAVIEYRGSQFFLRDCNSSNGSLVNGDRVSERSLRDGDLVAIGTARLLFREEIEIEDPGAKVVQHPSAPRLHCPTCNADYRKGDLFCRQCGGPLAQSVPPKAVCTSCGTVVPLPAHFCNACGNVLPQDDHLEATKPRPIPPEEAPAPAAVPASAPEVKADPASLPPEPSPTAASAGVVEPPPASPRSLDAPRAARASAAAEPALPPVRPAAESLRPAPAPKPAPPPASAAAPARPWPRAGSSEAAARGFERPFDPRPGAHAEEAAGVERRLAAGLIDGVLVSLGQGVLLAPVFYYWWARELPSNPAEVPFLPILLSLGLVPLAAILGAVYYIYFWGVSGATVGKRILGIAVEGADGEFPIGIPRAGVRFLGYLLSAALLGIGFLMVAFGGSGLHDRIAGTRVVRRTRG